MRFNNKAPRQLSENTIRRYDADQLLRHLDRFLERAFPQYAPYLVRFDDIYRLEGDDYTIHFPSANRYEIEEVLRDTYSRARSSH